MGLQNAFFEMGLDFDSAEAKQLSTTIQEEIYFTALKTSCRLARELGPHANFAETRAADGQLQFDLWGIKPSKAGWVELRKEIQEHGLRNSLLLAIAPTATICFDHWSLRVY